MRTKKNNTMSRLYIFTALCLMSAHLITQIDGSGLFELKLKYFMNERGVDNEGACCSGRSAPVSGNCIGLCKTRFRACLKHYQAKIDPSSPCTFGDVITPVLEGNVLNLTEQSKQVPFENPIRFPFEFGWPGTFTLIVEAWLDTNETTSRSHGVLISRLSIQRVLDVSTDWTEDSYNSSHTTMQYAFRVTCDASYYGAGCANLCRKRDDQFGHYTCSPTGERVCLAGWKGDYCTTPRCTAGCDEQHGHCNRPNECICQSGWKGSLCSECEPYPGCMHGTCKKPWECLCNEGWGGLFCNQDLNFCTNHKPCQNGGTCFNTGQGSYTCKCPPGYTGTDCETRINNCAATPCLNSGMCHDEKHGYRCVCPKGWIGTHCEKETVTCAEKPCLHGACTDTSLGFKCECPVGYSGTVCDVQVDECNPSPCENGGTCFSKGETFKCLCPSGYSGIHCEVNIDDCQGNPCLNGGSCVDMVNQFRCQCIPGFIGSLCENKVDLCLTKPCANGGTCTNLNNDYRCKCRPGFTGKDCSIDVDECSSSPCRNGGTCVNRVNSFQCVCAGGFRGTTCEEEALSAGWDATSGSVISAHVAASGHHEAHASGRSDGLSSGQIALIAIFSIATPLAAFIATAVVICMKRKRRREQEKDDAEARKQNEQNASHMTHHHHNSVSSSKRSSSSALTNLDTSHHMIKNTWDKSVNNMSTSASLDDACLMNSSMYGGIPTTGYCETNSTSSDQCYQATVIPSTLQRAKSQKQLNTDPVVMHRASQIIVSTGAVGGGQSSQQLGTACSTGAPVSVSSASAAAQSNSKDIILEAKRISVLSDAAASICNSRWSGASPNRQIIGPCSPPHV